MRLHMPVHKQFMYKRLKKIRARAILVGMIYFIGVILLAVLALLPTLKVDYLAVIPGLGGDKMIWEDMHLSWDIQTLSRLVHLVALGLVVILIPFLAGRRLNWLFTKRPVKRKARASLRYDMATEQDNYRGFNRNVYAMKDIANWFAWSFAILSIENVIICALNGSYGGEKLFDFSKFSEVLVSIGDLGLGLDIALPVAVISIVVGFIITLIGRLLAVKVRLFTSGSGKTAAGESRFSIFLRTIFQYVLIIVVPMFMLQVNTLNEVAVKLLALDFNSFSVLELITAGVELAVWFAWLALTYCPIIYCHKCMVSEYNDPGQGTDYYYMLGVSVISILLCAGLFVVKGNFTFDFTNVTSLNVLVLLAVLLVTTLATRFLTKASARYSEYEQVISMVTSNDEFEDVDWRYFFSDNYIGGEESGDIIE